MKLKRKGGFSFGLGREFCARKVEDAAVQNNSRLRAKLRADDVSVTFIVCSDGISKPATRWLQRAGSKIKLVTYRTLPVLKSSRRGADEVQGTLRVHDPCL